MTIGNEEDSGALRGARAQIKRLEEELKNVPDRAQIEREVRESIERAETATALLESAGYPSKMVDAFLTAVGPGPVNDGEAPVPQGAFDNVHEPDN